MVQVWALDLEDRDGRPDELMYFICKGTFIKSYDDDDDDDGRIRIQNILRRCLPGSFVFHHNPYDPWSISSSGPESFVKYVSSQPSSLTCRINVCM